MRFKLLKVTIFLMFILILLIACGSETNETAYETVSSASLEPGDSIPAPTEAVILTLSGDIGTKNVEDTLAFDIATLEKVGLVEYEVSDPWLETKVTYTGVLLADLLAVAGVSDTGKTVNVFALDGYATDLPLSDTEEWPVLLATQSNGSYMSIEQNGPTRIIYPYDAYPSLSTARDRSVWNIEGIIVK